MAQCRKSMTVDEILQLHEKPVAWPITRSMCVPMGNGDCSIVVASSSTLSRFDAARALRIRGMRATIGRNRSPGETHRQLTRVACERTYDRTGSDPLDVSLAELHNASAIAAIDMEDCRFRGYGDGGAIVVSGATPLGGCLPINSSGGSPSKGHPIGATSAVPVRDLVAQSCGEAKEAQLRGARIGLTENGGGLYRMEEATFVVTVLASSHD